MTILALDLGTKTGWCVGSKGAHASGTWNLAGGRFSGGGMRFVHLRQRLEELRAGYKLTAVYFEEVRRHRGVDAAHVYGGMLAILTAWCEENGIPYEGVPVGEIKKSFTGKGNSDKNAMIAEAEKRGYEVVDDNQVDAIALFVLKAGENVEPALTKEAAE